MAQGNCPACGQFKRLDRCHLRSKGAGGTWDGSNVLLMCRSDHILQHSLGWKRFLDKYPHLINILDDKGYELVNEFNIYKLRRK